LNSALVLEVQRLGGDPTDMVWRWFLLNGPHGPSFTWGQTRKEPPGYVGIDHLRKSVAELEAQDPLFVSRAKEVALVALQSHSTNFVRRAIQVLAAVGSDSDLGTVLALTAHGDNAVVGDARACAFELERQVRSGRAL
jgi:hypothetical protein